MESFCIYGQIIALTVRKKLLIGGFLVLVVLTGILLNYKCRPIDSFKYVREEDVIPVLRNGDIICRLGDRVWSDFFKEISPRDKRFSHLGIVRIEAGNVSVINAEGLAVQGKDYVNEVPLGEFLKIARRAGVFRLRHIEGKSIADKALDFKGRPFDWRFDMSESGKLYCSELLYTVVKELSPGTELKSVWQKELGRYVIPVDICSQPEYFEEVACFGK